MNHFDVIVCGGGPSGIAAAITAARSGAKTLLIEKSDQLGGMGTLAAVHTFCGLYCPIKPQLQTPQFANPGFASETATQLIRDGIAKEPVKMGKHFVLPHSPLLLAPWWKALAQNEPNLEISFDSHVQEGQLNSAQDRAVSLTVRSRLYPDASEITATSWIDATGNAVLAQIWNQPIVSESLITRQRSAWITGYAGFPADFVFTESIKLRWSVAIAQGIRSGELPTEALGTHFRESAHENPRVWMTLDLTDHVQNNISEDQKVGIPHQKGIEWSARIAGYLSEHVTEWAKVKLTHEPQSIGTRESHRWIGQTTLTGKQLLDGFQAEDPVANVSWPIELRENGSSNYSPRFRPLPSDPMPTIPQRCLQAQNLKNVYACGRILSADHEALASIRVMGISLATGEAAGKLALDSNPTKFTKHR